MGKYFSRFIPCLIVMTIIEFVTPQNNKQKQVQFAASIMFIIMTFIPMFEYLFKSDFSQIFLKTEYEIDNIYIKTSMQEQNLEDFYTNKLKNEYENRLYQNLNIYLDSKGFDIKDKYEIIYEDNPQVETFGIIRSVNITDLSDYNENEIEKIKKLISDFYIIDIENINIEETSSEVK